MTSFHSRLAAHRLVREINRSLVENSNGWTIAADAHREPVLTRDTIVLRVKPRAVRLFDAIHLFCDGVEIWLPLAARLRLRMAVGSRLIHFAREHWKSAAAPAASRKRVT